MHLEFFFKNFNNSLQYNFDLKYKEIDSISRIYIILPLMFSTDIYFNALVHISFFLFDRKLVPAYY